MQFLSEQLSCQEAMLLALEGVCGLVTHGDVKTIRVFVHNRRQTKLAYQGKVHIVSPFRIGYLHQCIKDWCKSE